MSSLEIQPILGVLGTLVPHPMEGAPSEHSPYTWDAVSAVRARTSVASGMVTGNVHREPLSKRGCLPSDSLPVQRQCASVPATPPWVAIPYAAITHRGPKAAC